MYFLMYILYINSIYTYNLYIITLELNSLNKNINIIYINNILYIKIKSL